MKKNIVIMITVAIFCSCKSSYLKQHDFKTAMNISTLSSQTDSISKYFSNMKVVINDSLYLIR
jgi:cell division protein FtsL